MGLNEQLEKEKAPKKEIQVHELTSNALRKGLVEVQYLEGTDGKYRTLEDYPSRFYQYRPVYRA